jgi:hypothetical protein
MLAPTHHSRGPCRYGRTDSGATLALRLVKKPLNQSFLDKVCADASILPKIAFEGMDIATLRGLIAVLHPSLGMSWIDQGYLPPSAIVFRSFIRSRFPEREGLSPA